MRKTSSKPVMGGPQCPKCGQPPYDLKRVEREAGKPPLNKTVWFCPNAACNKEGIILEDSEVW
jgi:hypothetical protein